MTTSAVLSVDKGERLTATFNYPGDITGRVATFVVRPSVKDEGDPLIQLVSGEASGDGAVVVDGPNKVVLLTINAPATALLPASSKWAMWLDAGEDNAEVISGDLRAYETVAPA